MAEDGARVVLLGRDPDRGRAAQETLGANALFLPCDVGDPGQVRAGFLEALDWAGRLDFLVHAAGHTRDRLVLRMREGDWEEVLRAHLTGGYLCGREALRIMAKARRGAMVFVSSVVGLTGNVGQANYAAAKAGLVALARTLAQEAGPWGIRVNAVSAGVVDTDALKHFPNRDDILGNSRVKTPAGRLTEPEDVARVVLFLVSPLAEMVIGQTVTVDGGYSVLA